MSNRSLARKNRFKYRALRKSHSIFKPWIVAMGGVDKLNANGRIYIMFPKLGENRHLGKETEEATRIIRSGGLKRGEVAHPQSFSISSRYDPDPVVQFNATTQESTEMDTYAKQVLEAYGAYPAVVIPPIWGGGDALDFISKEDVSVGKVKIHTNTEKPDWDKMKLTPEVNLESGGSPGLVPDFISVWSEHLLKGVGVDLTQPVTAPAFANANKSSMAVRGTTGSNGNPDIVSYDLCVETTATVKLMEEIRKNKLKEAIKVTSQLMDNFPETYHEDFLSDSIKVFAVDERKAIHPVPRTEPMFGIALCSVISNPKQTEILFEQGFVSTYVSIGKGADSDVKEYHELIVHKSDVHTWKPEVTTLKNRKPSPDDKHIFHTPEYNPMLDLDITREIEIELKPWK